MARCRLNAALRRAFDTPLGSVGSLLPAGVCYRALRRLPGQDLHLLEQRVFRTHHFIIVTKPGIACVVSQISNSPGPGRTPHNGIRNKTARFDASIWIARCSGPRRISKTSCSISGHTSTIIARILPWKGEHLTKTRLCRVQSPISIPMDGKATVEASITHQWLPDSPKTRAPRSIQRTSTNCTANEPRRCLSW